MSADKAIQIKGMLSRKKDKIKHQKNFRIVFSCMVIALCVAAGFYTYAHGTVNEYHAMSDELEVDREQVVKDQIVIAETQKELEVQKQELAEEQEALLSTAELIAKNNQSIIEQNIRLQDTLKIAASVGIKPQNYDDAEAAESAVDFSKLEYIGEFEGTAYTPSPEECSNNLGYTASGKPIVAGVSIAVDTDYWKLGTEFYIEGLGYVVAMDTGNAVKGKYRFDYAVFDKDFAWQLGRRDWKVYKVLK